MYLLKKNKYFYIEIFIYKIDIFINIKNKQI